MIKEAIQYLMDAGRTEIHKLNNQIYSTKRLSLVEEESPNPLKLSTLTGLVDYIKEDVDQKEHPWVIHVVNFDLVSLLSPLKNDFSRNLYINATAMTPNIQFNQFHHIEQFNIMLQSCFLENENKASILKIIGNIKEENVRNTGDDGISQSVTAKVGIAKVDNVVVPNPVSLIPFKTFAEVEQPEIKFVFRMKDGPQAALFEADGGAWKLRTILKIKEFLFENLKDHNVKIIA